MISNEQRAHDLALLFVKLSIDNKESIINELDNKDEHINIDVLNIYNHAYKAALDSFNSSTK